MTEITAEQISAEASQIKFTVWLATAVRTLALGSFSAFGYVIGSAWFCLVFCCLALKYGFLHGARVPVPTPKRPSIPQ
jgi:hypothetical protein